LVISRNELNTEIIRGGMSMIKPLVLVVGMNLLEGEIKDDDKMKKIEEVVSSILSSHVSGGVTEEEMIFHFSIDPSVTSPVIPVVFRITLLPSKRIRVDDINNDRIAEKISELIRAVLPERPNILILVETLTWQQASIATV
jgi:hypothetical protein